jgi:hypothetical protein
MRGASRGDPEVEQSDRAAPEMRRPPCPGPVYRVRPAKAAARRLRMGLATPSPGGPRPAVRWHYDRPPQWLHVRGRQRVTGVARKVEGGPKGAFLSPARKRGLGGQKSPPVERRVASAPIARRASASPGGSKLVRHAALHSPRLPAREQGRPAYPAPRQRTGAMMLVLAHTGQARP